MAVYDTGGIYDTGLIYDGGPSETISNGTVEASPGSRILEDNGTNINGIFNISRVDHYNSNTENSLSDTYDMEDRNLANTESPSSFTSTITQGNIVLPSTDVVIAKDGGQESTTIPNAGSRFMR